MPATMRIGESGATGWGYADVLPYFRRMEHPHGGEAPWRGTGGRFMSPAARATTRCMTPQCLGRGGGHGDADHNGYRQEVRSGRHDGVERAALVGGERLSEARMKAAMCGW